MKKAIQIAYNDRFEYKCECAAKAGFRDISVNYTEVLGKSESEWKRITEDIARILDKNNLSCIQTHPHYYNLLISSEILEEDMEFAIRQSIISGSALGAKYHAIHPRSAVNFAYGRKKSFEDNKRWMGGLLECATKHGTAIAAENLPIFPASNKIMPFYSANVEDLCELVDDFADPNMVICWDFGHAHLTAQDHAKAIEMTGNRIKCTHVHNNFGNSDRHSTVDNGNIEWEKVMTSLARTGYQGALTLETHCLYPTDEMLLAFAKYNYAGLVYLETLFSEAKG